MSNKCLVSVLMFISFSVLANAQSNFKSISDKNNEPGCVSGDCVNGYGTMNYDDGDVYKGYFLDSKRNGFGHYKYIEGDVYEGLWENGKRKGIGYYMWPSGNEYIGYWNDDKQNGKGTKYYLDGTTEAGDWVDGSFQP